MLVSNCLLLFPVPPKILPFTFGERPLNEGELVTVPCAVVKGDAPVTLRWLFNGQNITPRMRITVVPLGVKNVILSVGSVQASHVGQYTCIAENRAGAYEYSANMTVNGTSRSVDSSQLSDMLCSFVLRKHCRVFMFLFLFEHLSLIH